MESHGREEGIRSPELWDSARWARCLALGVTGSYGFSGLWAEQLVPACVILTRVTWSKGNIGLLCQFEKGHGWGVGSGMAVLCDVTGTPVEGHFLHYQDPRNTRK